MKTTTQNLQVGDVIVREDIEVMTVPVPTHHGRMMFIGREKGKTFEHVAQATVEWDVLRWGS